MESVDEWVEPLKLFSEDNKCVKCGASGACVEHVGIGFSLPAHLRRTCARCGYRWPERPLDGKGDVTNGK